MNALQKIFDLGLRKPAVTLSDTERATRRPPASLPAGERADELTYEPLSISKFDNKRTILLFLFVAAGAIAQSVFRDYSTTGAIRLSWLSGLWGFVLGAVILRYLFTKKLEAHNTTMQCFIAFEHGFFGDAILRSIAGSVNQM